MCVHACVCVCVCVCARLKWEVGGNDLTLSQAMLYLWLLSVRSYEEGLSVDASHGTGYRQEQWPTGGLC